MFGTLRASACQLGDERQDYRRLYCGTCKALGDGYGQLSRGLLSYDVVLLASVVEGLLAAPSDHDSCRCPLMPLIHRPTLSPDSLPMLVASASQIVLADQWFADQVADGRKGAGLARVWSDGKAKRAWVSLETLGVDTSGLRQLSSTQVAIERAGSALSPSDAASPTADALGSLFAQLHKMEGVVEHATPAVLRRLGKAIGTVVYLVDALEDLERDAGSGDFNPALDSAGRPSPVRIGHVASILSDALATIREAVDVLPWQRNLLIVRSVLCQRLPRRARRAVTEAEAFAEAWAPPTQRPAALKVLRFMAVMVSVLVLLPWRAVHFVLRRARTSSRGKGRRRRPARLRRERNCGESNERNQSEAAACSAVPDSVSAFEIASYRKVEALELNGQQLALLGGFSPIGGGFGPRFDRQVIDCDCPCDCGDVGCCECGGCDCGCCDCDCGCCDSVEGGNFCCDCGGRCCDCCPCCEIDKPSDWSSDSEWSSEYDGTVASNKNRRPQNVEQPGADLNELSED